MTTYIRSLKALIYRDLIRFFRQRSRVIGAVITPLLFWLLLGVGFGDYFQAPSSTGQQGYLYYFFPGMLALSVLFTAIFSTISVIEDRHEGFLQGVLVSPLSPSCFLLSKLLAGAFLGFFQGGLLLLSAPFLGISLTIGSLLLVGVVLFLSSMALTCLGFLLAWKIDSVSGYHSMMNVLLMPMWLLSGAVFPLEGRGWFLSLLAKLNPLSYSMSALRALIFEGVDPLFFRNIMALVVVLLAFYVPTIFLVKKRS